MMSNREKVMSAGAFPAYTGGFCTLAQFIWALKFQEALFSEYQMALIFCFAIITFFLDFSEKETQDVLNCLMGVTLTFALTLWFG